MKRLLPSEPPLSLVAYELMPGRVLFVHALPPVPTFDHLTPAEQEVLRMMLEGYSNAAIANARGTSPRTIANQVAQIFGKVGVRSRGELAAKALRTHGARASDPEVQRRAWHHGLASR